MSTGEPGKITISQEAFLKVRTKEYDFVERLVEVYYLMRFFFGFLFFLDSDIFP
jgi:hypothetical protein